MAINIAGLSTNISETIKGIGAELGIISDNPGRLFPSGYESATSTKRPEVAWNKLPFPYTFSVVDLNNRDSKTTFADFSLPIAPSSLSQSEDFAISIKPTQGGTVTTHSGNKYKTLSISGTTGINPFRGLAGVDVTTGRAIAKPNQIKFRSGYEVFQDLRNWFRVYYEFKKKDKSETARGYRLVFKNFRDGEFLVVELLKFTMDRTADRSLLYDYKMEFKVISNFNFQAPELSFLEKLDNLLNKAVSKIDTARGIFLRTQEVLRNVESTYNSTVIEPLRKISLATKAFAGISIVAADVGNRIIKNTVTASDALNILKTLREQQELARSGASNSIPYSIRNANLPSDLEGATANRGSSTIIDLDEALLDLSSSVLPKSTNDDMAKEISDVQELPRSFYETTRDRLRRIKNNAEDKFNLSSSTYDDLFNRTSTSSAESAKVVTNDEFDLLGAFNEAITAINQLLSSERLFKTEFEERIAGIESQFIDEIDIRALPAIKQIIMPGDTDLEQIALDELGNPSRWIEIAELNDLRAPYVVQDLSYTRSNVVKPGDSLLIPQDNIFGPSEIPKVKTIPSTLGLSEIEKSLGTDIRINPKTFDLALSNDLLVISGTDNMAQGIVLKLQYERGELKEHPNLGVGVQIGSKFLKLEDIRDNLINTLTQDSRVESVSDVQLLKEGSSLFMLFKVNIKRIDVPVPLRIKL